MNPEEYARMHALEDWYWWFVARRTAAAQFVRDYAPPDRPLRILDAGCGTGAMLDVYKQWPDAIAAGVDLSPHALGFTHSRGHHRLVGADLTCLPFKTGTFDVVSALDVIEHVPNDSGAIAEICRVLRPGGILVASVPAYQFLWGPHDEALHHCRRYTAPQFRDAIHQSGLRVEKLTYLLTLLFPVAVAVRLASRGKKGTTAAAVLPRVPPWLNRALIGVQDAELGLARAASLPFGLGMLAVARKPVPAKVLSPAEEGIPAHAARW